MGRYLDLLNQSIEEDIQGNDFNDINDQIADDGGN